MIKSVFFFLVVYNRSRGEKMKLLASDVDNTLLFDGKYIKEEDVKKIKEFQEKGHVFGVCTGRNLEGVVKPSQPYHIDYDFYIVLSGALIFNKKKEIIFEKKMPMSLIEDIFLSLNKQHATIVCPDKMYRISSDGFNDEFCEVISSLKDIPYEYVNSISFHFEKDEIEKAREATEFLKEKFQGQIEVFQNNEHIDIAMQGCSKGNGLKMIQEYFHIHEDDLFCIGDSWNDLPMFQECKHPYTFTYAPEDVKEKAEEIVESLAECIEDIMK